MGARVNCPECSAPMFHAFVEDWRNIVSYDEEGEVVHEEEMLFDKGQWACSNCGHVIDEDDEGYKFPD